MAKGLYIHIPFCGSKCPYCDFYSIRPTDELIEKYTLSVCKALKNAPYEFDTVYFGGGTPSRLGADNICRILESVRIESGAEITVECNPSDCCEENSFDFSALSKSGVNRISLGLQSGIDTERKALGRRAGVKEAEAAINRAQKAGIDNITLDLMLGVPGQTADTLKESVNFCVSSGAKHISAYILKIEEGTYFYKNRDKLNLPDEDACADLYLECCELIEQSGMRQYEISNFAYPGFESRHNLKYWHCEEYLGIGPAAHSFIDGKRFYYPRDIDSFMNGCAPVNDGDGGDFEEYAMLALRLTEGLSDKKTRERYGFGIPRKIFDRAEKLTDIGLLNIDSDRIYLTKKGFLVSNSVITELLT